MKNFKLYIQTVYIPRENILFLDEWFSHHMNLGVDEFWMYDNTGSKHLDFIGNLEITGTDRQGNPVLEKTKNLTDEEIEIHEKKLFEKYNAKKISWKPLNSVGQITYNQLDAIYDFKEKVKHGFCCFIDIDEFIMLKNEKNIKDYIKKKYTDDKEGIRIQQKRYASRWENPVNVLSIKKTFDIDTTMWAPKNIANIEKINKKLGSNIHNFIDSVYLEKEDCFFNHYNHNKNVHNWLLGNSHWLDKNWMPKSYEELW